LLDTAIASKTAVRSWRNLAARTSIHNHEILIERLVDCFD
jgi:hypothetical protein